MRDGRFLGSLLCVLLLAPLSRAQPVPLTEAVQPGDCFRVEMDMKLVGQLKVSQQGSTNRLKLEATGTLALVEKVLSATTDRLADKVARQYETARARILVGIEKSERTLRPERRLVVAQRHKDAPLVYSPTGGLTRDESDLTAQHFDTLFLTGLLPPKAVAAGDTWKVPSHVMQALCNFEGVTEQDVTGTLTEVKEAVATLTFTGTATGIDGGALVKAKVAATATYDRTSKRLVRLEWQQDDERDQGPVSPASTLKTNWTLTRKPVAVPESLNEVALVGVPDGFSPPAALTALEHRDRDSRYRLLYARDWHIVGNTANHLVMRLMDRGDFLAQVTLAPWAKGPTGKPIPAEELKDVVRRTPGWVPEQELQAGPVPGLGNQVQRLAVAGKLDGVAVVQNFYLVTGPTGAQVIVTFTMTPKQVEKFGARDLNLIGGLEVPVKK